MYYIEFAINKPFVVWRRVCFAPQLLDHRKTQLRETAMSVAQVAYSIGYESEEAFSRAFKREVGMSPRPWRRQQVSN